MSLNIRFRLIQILEIVLWLGAVLGIVRVALTVWPMRDQGWRAMLDVAAPALLGIGAVVIALMVLIGIYHNTRRNADALDRLAKQGAGTMRRLPGAARAEVAAAAAMPVPAAPISPAPPPIAARQAKMAPVPEQPPVVTEAAPATEKTAEGPRGPAPVLRGSSRRLGPAS